jgi:hypothetical protein
MFDEIRNMLPNYANRVEIIRDRHQDEHETLVWRETHECLFKALSLVYVDILQFCHDACRLFSKKRLGKLTFFWKIFSNVTT